MSGTLVIIDDDRPFCNLLREYFQDDYDLAAFTEPAKAIEYIRGNPVDVVLTDLSMPAISGLDVLEAVKKESPNTDVIIMTAFAKIDTAVEAMKKGAYDYVVKPFTTDELSLHLKNIFERRRLLGENADLRKYIDTKYKPENIIGESRGMKEVFRFVRQVSQTDLPVVITGESGTGKELVARAVHFSGERKDRKIFLLHCADLPAELLETELFGLEKEAPSGERHVKKGLFETAGGGTIIFEEIGDMEISLQRKLHEALETRTVRRIGGRVDVPFDVIVIATTHRDLNELRREGKVLPELFYHNAFDLAIPPLRERREDIPVLAKHFFELYKNEFEKSNMELSPEAMNTLLHYDWPGNVRELKNFFARLCLLEDVRVIKPEHVLRRLGFYDQSLLKRSGSRTPGAFSPEAGKK